MEDQVTRIGIAGGGSSGGTFVNAAAENSGGSNQQAPSPQVSFFTLFAPQDVQLFFTGQPPAGLPPNFTLTPSFDLIGNLQLSVSDPNWTVRKAMFDSSTGICIVLENVQNDLLMLVGIMGPDLVGAFGQWTSTLATGGSWTSNQNTAVLPPLPQQMWWTFVLNLPNSSGFSDLQDVALQLELDSPPPPPGTTIAVPYHLTGVFPPNFSLVGDITIQSNGISLQLTDGGVVRELDAGAFSGGIGHLVCQGTVLPVTNNLGEGVNQDLATGDGTWTGTSGGPMTLPPPPGGNVPIKLVFRP